MVDENSDAASPSRSRAEKEDNKRTISPYDLSAADNPGAVIAYPLLRSNNYDEWSISFKTALCSRKKFGFLDGSILKPQHDSPEYEEWIAINALLVSWIKMTIHESIRSSISHRENAKELWDSLKKRYSVSSGPRLQQIKFELANCKQAGQSIEVYFGKLTKIWDTLNTIQPMRHCKCGTCSCDVVELQEKDRENDHVAQLLYGLDTRFDSIRSTITSRIPLPSVEEAYNLLRQEEDMHSQRILEERNDVMALAINTKNRANDVSLARPQCSHCKRKGHSIEQCFFLVGFPEWWGDRPKGKNTQHKSQQKTVNTTTKVTANAVRSSSSSQNTVPLITESDRASMSGLSNDQWQTVMRLLNAARSSSSETLSGMNCDSKSFSWVLDTGASHHMTSKLELLKDLRNIAPVNVVLADGSERLAIQEGTIRLGSDLILQSVFYVESLTTNLISVAQLLDENDCVLQLTNKFLLIQDRVTKTVTGLGRRCNGTFYFQGVDYVQVRAVKTDNNGALWHHRFGHPSERVLSSISGVDFSSFPSTCETFLRAKQTRDPFAMSLNKAADVFDLIHCDIWGPYRSPSSCGARFFLTVVDDHSRSVWIFLLHNKSDTQSKLRDFISLVKRQFGKDIKTIRSDNGTEFTCMSSYFSSLGIIHETSCVGTPNQNGRVERKHRHILNVARALRFQASLPITFWGECVLTAGYLINRTPSVLLGGKSPYEILHQSPPPISHLRVFGCVCYAHNQKTNGDKFASRSRKCIFVGYPYGQKGWRLYDVEENVFLVSRDVRFCETDFYFQHSDEATTEHDEDTVQLVTGPTISDSFVAHEELFSDPTTDISLSTSRHLPDTTSTNNSPPIENSIADPITPPSPITDSSPVTADTTLPVCSQPSVPLRTSSRQRQPSIKLKDYILNSAQAQLIDTPPGKSLYPLSNYVTNFRLSENHRAFQAAITAANEPQSYSEASKHKEWRLAMREEIDAQELNHTWDIVDLPPGKRAIGCKWVYKFKFKSDGTLERHKARLVALGNKQKEGVDYDETFAPVAKMGTVRLFLKFAASKAWPVHQMDVHNAFLHGDLKEEVYMRLPPGFNTDQKGKVCQLRKSIYGLKQSPRCWFAKLSSALKEYGFLQSHSDYSLFTFDQAGTQLRILVYVDDLIIAGSCATAVQNFKAYLSQHFRMKDLGLLKYFLGIEVARNKDGFYMCQRKYALDIIADCGLLGAKPLTTPLPVNHKLALANTPKLVDPSPYRRLIGRLIYLANTRPDLAYSVHTLAQFMQAPSEAHWDAALRVVRYIKLNPGQGILLHSTADLSLTGWCDSDWASCPLTRKSLTGYVVQLGGSSISWKTKKQPTISRSSAEAEYRSMAMLTQELIWLKRLLHDLCFDHTAPMRICSDSKSAIDMAKNPVFHERTKHVGVDCHFIREEVISSNVQPLFVPTTEQLADLLTKPLSHHALSMHNSKLGILDIHAPACGRVNE